MFKRFYFLLLLLTMTASSFGQKFEAESATLTGGVIKVVNSSESGGYSLAQNSGELAFNLNKTLVTPNPTDEVVRLYQFLLDNYGKKIISGVMTLGSMDEVTWLKTNTGKEPALVGLDFMHCGWYDWYNNNEPMNDALKYYNKNGIPAVCWHWRDPSRKTESFYTKETAFDISKIFDETSAEYKAMIKDIDYIAGLLKKAQLNKVPIIWRPLHEAAGGWFWWGAKGAAPCKKLYQIMFDRMVNYHGLHNLIWVWTREPNDDAWYPGDEYVDLVGRDIYKTGDHSSQLKEFNDMNNRYGAKKMVAISECGSMPDPDNLVKDGAAWSYFMPWYGGFVRDSKNNSLDLWKKLFASDYVLTLDEMPNLKTYITPDINTGSNTKPDNKAIRAYPTYFIESFNIQSGQIIKSISVFNQIGVRIKTLKPEGNNTLISLAGYPSGMYLVKADEKQAAKVIKK